MRATNWVGDAVMSLPALREIRRRFPQAHLAVLARPSVAELYAREHSVDAVIRLTTARGRLDLSGKWKTANELHRQKFDCAILLQNAFEAALLVWLARIPIRIGYDRDGRRRLLTHPIAVPKRGEIPRHERFYYLELLRRAGIVESAAECLRIRLDGIDAARAAGLALLSARGLSGPLVGVSPGAAYGGAKRWLPERFAEAAVLVARSIQASVALFGAPSERPLCATIARQVEEAGVATINFSGETSLKEFIELAATCRVFLTNDSGGMHVASALGLPTVAIFGATDEVGTGPTGELARVVREPVDCAPCLLRECPIDHRCMTRISSQRVAETALDLLK